MIDLHSHTLLSDGELGIDELVRRAEMAGYRGLVVSDHVDGSVMDWVVPRVVKEAAHLSEATGLWVVPGCELTHCRPEDIAGLVKEARGLGAKVVTVHGETLAEPVIPGTNRAAIEAGADLLAHPGLISAEDAKLAAGRGVMLEISGRKGHCLSNGHVAKTAREHGAKVYFGSDAHAPEDLAGRAQAERICLGAGLSAREVSEMFERAERVVREAVKKVAR
jgi:putative hydrolase